MSPFTQAMAGMKALANLAALAIAVAAGAACMANPQADVVAGHNPTTTTYTIDTTPIPSTTTTVSPAVTSRALAAEASRAVRPRPVAQSTPAGVGTYSGGDWRALVASLPWPTATAFRIIQCESGGRPDARNPSSTARGLFQVLGGSLDPIANTRQAFAMWQSRGWQPWAASRACWG